jgi:hypothetical protein
MIKSKFKFYKNPRPEAEASRVTKKVCDLSAGIKIKSLTSMSG